LAGADTEFKYSYEARHTIPHVLPSGKITSKEWAELTKRLDIIVPVHSQCKRKEDRITDVFVVPFFVALLGLTSLCVVGAIPSVNDAVSAWMPANVCIAAGVFGPIITGFFAFKVHPDREKRIIFAWLRSSDFELWQALEDPLQRY